MDRALSTLQRPCCAHTDTQTKANTLAVRSCAGQHPSGRVLLSPAGSWQMPRLLPVITLDLSQTVSLSLCSPLLSGFLSFSPGFISPSLSTSLLSLFLSDSGPRRHPILFPSLFSPACSALSSSSSVHSDELVSLQVSSGLSQHGCVAEGREHGGLC